MRRTELKAGTDGMESLFWTEKKAESVPAVVFDVARVVRFPPGRHSPLPAMGLPEIPKPATNGDLEAMTEIERLLREYGPSGKIRGFSGPLPTLSAVIRNSRKKGWREVVDPEAGTFSVSATDVRGERRVWRWFDQVRLLMLAEEQAPEAISTLAPVQAVPGGYALRGYQQRAVDAVERAWQEMATPEAKKRWAEKEAREKKPDPVLQKLRRRAVLLQSVTGSGKTVMMVKLIQLHLARGGIVVVLAHMLELLEQTRAKLIGDGLNPDLIGMVSSIHPAPTDRQTVLISTDKSGPKLLKMLAHRGNIMVVIDECHHAMSKQYIGVVSGLNPVKVLGATATPTRADGRGLGRMFGSMVSAMTYADAFDPLPDGSPAALVRPRYLAASRPDLARVKFNKRTGEFDALDVEAAMSTPVIAGEIIKHADQHYRNKKAIAFCATRKHGREVCELYKRNGYDAEYLDGETPKAKRAEILGRYRTGETMVLCNVLVGAEGFDEPSIEVVVNLVPRATPVLWIQTVGRASRPCTGKTEALVVDHTDTLARLGPVESYDSWTLSEAPGANKSGGGGKPAAQCAACGVDLEGGKCPNCGGEVERGRDTAGQILSALDCDLVEYDDKEAIMVASVRTGGHAALVRMVFNSKKPKAQRQAVANRAFSDEQKAEIYAQMCQYAVSVGKSAGFGFVLFLDMFGQKPAWSAVPPRAPVSAENMELFRALARRMQVAQGLARGAWRTKKINPKA